MSDDYDGAPEELIANVAGEARRERMVRWLLDHPEFDHIQVKGKITFDIGRRPNSGLPAVSVAFHPASEEI